MTGSGFFGIPQIHKPRSMAMFTGHGAFFWDRLKHDGFNLDIYRIHCKCGSKYSKALNGFLNGFNIAHARPMPCPLSIAY